MSKGKTGESPKQAQPSESSNPLQIVRKESSPKELLQDAAKLTFLAAFALYSLGFIIWHAYLADYGVSSLQFLQIDYLSAAFCYLLNLAVFAVPSALIYRRFLEAINAHSVPSTDTKQDANAIRPLNYAISTTFLWIVIIFVFNRIIFPEGFNSPNSKFLLGAVIATIAIDLLKVFTSYFWKEKRFSKYLQKVPPYAWFFVVFALNMLWNNPEASKPFLILTLCLYPIGDYYLGNLIDRLEIKYLTLTAWILLVILHAAAFGALQFGRISRSWGGGKPEIAYLKFGANHSDMASYLGLKYIEGVPPLKGFCGPVSLLLRSDKELVFLNEADKTTSPFATNDAGIIFVTNTTSILVTNLSNPVVLGVGAKTTNEYTLLTTNIDRLTITTNFGKALVPNPVRLTAKQVKMDSIDALVYGKKAK